MTLKVAPRRELCVMYIWSENVRTQGSQYVTIFTTLIEISSDVCFYDMDVCLYQSFSEFLYIQMLAQYNETILHETILTDFKLV